MTQTCLALFAMLFAPQDFEKSYPRPGGTPSRPGDWTMEWRTRGRFEYNSNVFLLDHDHVNRLKDDLPADQASGRYKDMNSADDLLFIPDLRLEAKGPGLFGRKLEAWIDLEFPIYSQNAQRTHVDVELGVTQAIGSNGRLSFSVGILPEYFNKNYLADGVDANANGNISSSERIYEEGVYREFDLELEYRHQILDRNAQKPFGMEGTLALGYRDRTYNSPFDGRAESAFLVRIGVDFSYAIRNGGKGNAAVFKGGLRYDYESVDSPAEQEVVLLDEQAYGIDFSADGDPTDNNARTIQSVDRSRGVHRFGFVLGVGIGPKVDVGLEYFRTLKDFDSDNVFDPAHSGRKDTRDEFGLFGKYAFSAGWDAKVGFEWRRQSTDRPDDPGGTGEITDYRRRVFYISATYRW